jgi:putative ABC transport system substrate-binding protein
LAEFGYIEGRNVAIEFRFANNDTDRLPDLAADLVRRRVAVIATPASSHSLLTAKAATSTIPIVFSTGSDPVEAGYVASLNRPGGNVTGVTSMNSDVAPKRLGILHKLLPKAARFAVLLNPFRNLASVMVTELEAGVAAIGRQIEFVTVRDNREIDHAFSAFAQKQVDGLLISPGSLLDNRRVQLVIQAAIHRLPTIYPFRESVEVGGLMSYGSSAADRDRLVGVYTGRIRKGEKPADLPVMRAVKFEFIINLQTARALGIEVPPSLLAITDEVIE